MFIMARLSERVGDLIVAPDAIHLGAFLRGCATAFPALEKAIRGAHERVIGPSGADVFQRAALRAGNGIDLALSAVLDAFDAVEGAEPIYSAGPLGLGRDLIRNLVDVIDAGRPALLLAEASVLWLANFVTGHLYVLEQLDPVCAADIFSFLRFIESRHGCGEGCWHAALRLYGDHSLVGLARFSELWKEYCGAGVGLQRS